MVSDRPYVTLVAGDDASGLARMIGQYLEQVLAESERKRAEAAALHGRLGMAAREGNVGVTIAFDRDGIAIEEGLREPDAVIGGDIQYLLHVLAGRANPAWAMGEGRVTLRPGLQRPFLAYRAYRLMRLPGVHVWSGLPRPPAHVVVGAAAAIGVVVAAGLLWQARRSRARSS